MAQRAVLIAVDDSEDDQRAMQWAVQNLLRANGVLLGVSCGHLVYALCDAIDHSDFLESADFDVQSGCTVDRGSSQLFLETPRLAYVDPMHELPWSGMHLGCPTCTREDI